MEKNTSSSMTVTGLLKRLFPFSLALCLFFSSALSVSADSWTAYSFNNPTVYQTAYCDVTHNYFPITLSTTGTNNSSFPSNPYVGQTVNCMTVRPQNVYNSASQGTGYKYYQISGLDDYAGQLIFCYTVKNQTSNNYRGLLFKFRDNNDNILPCTFYVDGVLTSSVDGYISPPVPSGVYHIEAHIYCTQYRCQRLQVGYEYNNTQWYYKCPGYATATNGNMFDDVVLFKYSPPDTSFTYSTTYHKNGVFSNSVVVTGGDTSGEYVVKQYYCDLDAIPSSTSNEGINNNSSLIKLFSTSGTNLAVTSSETTFDSFKDRFVAYLEDKLRSTAAEYYQALPFYIQSFCEREYPGEDFSWIPEFYFKASQELGDPLLSEHTIRDVETNFTYHNYNKHFLLSDNSVTSSDGAFVPFNFTPILGTTSSYYLDAQHPVNVYFNVAQFYNTFHSSADWPTDNIINVVYFVYDADYPNIPISSFICRLPITEMFQSAFQSVSSAISDALHSDYANLDDVSLPSVDSSATDITRLQHLEGVEHLLNELSKNMAKGVQNIVNAINAQSYGSYSNTTYYSQKAVYTFENFEIPALQATYTFTSSLDGDVMAPVVLLRDYTTSQVGLLELGWFVGVVLGIEIIGYVIFAKRG